MPLCGGGIDLQFELTRMSTSKKCPRCGRDSHEFGCGYIDPRLVPTTSSEWRDAITDPPKEEKVYLVFRVNPVIGPGMDVARYRYDSDRYYRWNNVSGHQIGDQVTHWMTLPNPPEMR